MKTVFVTGGSGWLGRYVIARLLEAGHQVHATYRRKPIAELPCSWHALDLLQIETIAPLLKQVKPTHLVHLAWEAVPPQCYTSPLNEAWVRSSKELIRQFTAIGGQRILAAGTGAEYQWVNGYLSEASSELSYRTPYAACKNQLRQWLEETAEAASLSFCWARIFHLYGPHEPGQRLVSALIRSLLKQEGVSCTHGNQFRDFLYITDAADALVTLLLGKLQGAVNVASGQPVQLRRIGSLIGQALGGEERIRYGAVPSPEEEPLFVGADVARLTQEAGWRPQYTLEAGLSQTIHWWRQRQEQKP